MQKGHGASCTTLLRALVTILTSTKRKAFGSDLSRDKPSERRWRISHIGHQWRRGRRSTSPRRKWGRAFQIITASLLVFEIDVSERLPIGVADAEAFGTWRTSHGGGKRRSAWTIASFRLIVRPRKAHRDPFAQHETILSRGPFPLYGHPQEPGHRC